MGCASPDLADGIFQTRQPTQFCEWRNGVNGHDAVCYCGTNECNANEMLEKWIHNGGRCKLYSLIFVSYLRNRNSQKDQKSWDKYVAYYLSVKKHQGFKFKMHSDTKIYL